MSGKKTHPDHSICESLYPKFFLNVYRAGEGYLSKTGIKGARKNKVSIFGFEVPSYNPSGVIPESAAAASGTQEKAFNVTNISWVPACAGMTPAAGVKCILYFF